MLYSTSNKAIVRFKVIRILQNNGFVKVFNPSAKWDFIKICDKGDVIRCIMTDSGDVSFYDATKDYRRQVLPITSVTHTINGGIISRYDDRIDSDLVNEIANMFTEYETSVS